MSRTSGRSRFACSISSSNTWRQSIVESWTRRLRAVTLSRTFCSRPARVGEVADADAAPGDLVFVGRPDAARRRADLPLAAPRLGQQVEVAVVRQDQVRLVADEEPRADVDAVSRQLVDLGEQRGRIDDDAVADDAGDARMQDARRDEVQDELGAVDVDGVAGVVSALIARDDVETRRQQIDDLALAFIAPLGAEHAQIHIVHASMC